MKTREGRNETIQYLLEEVFLSALSDVETGLCGHADTEKGFYAGALAALQWVGKGTDSLEPGDLSDVMIRLKRFVEMMQEPDETPIRSTDRSGQKPEGRMDEGSTGGMGRPLASPKGMEEGPDSQGEGKPVAV